MMDMWTLLMEIMNNHVNFLHTNLIQLRLMTFPFQVEMVSINKFFVFGIFSQQRKQEMTFKNNKRISKSQKLKMAELNFYQKKNIKILKTKMKESTT